MTQTSTPQEIRKAQANAYRDAQNLLAQTISVPDSESLADQVYRETMEREIVRLSDLVREMTR